MPEPSPSISSKTPTSISPKKLIFVLIVASLSILAIVVFIKNREHNNVLSKIKANFENVEVKKSTFLNYSSQKITASSTDKKILLQIVEAIDTKDLSNIMKKLEDEITAVDEERVYFNPYEGENVVYSVPDEFKYIREKTSKDGLPQHYYIVYGNDIFSYFIFSEEQIRFKGIASVFSCKNNVYKIDIFSEVDSFNKDELLNELANFYCL